MSKILKFFTNKGSTVAYALLTAVFTLVPEDCFKIVVINGKFTDAINIFINRMIFCVIVFIIVKTVYFIYRKNRKKVAINGNNYIIQIEYGNLFAINRGKIIIDFDECFTTKVGSAPGDVKLESVCGQYLSKYPISNMEVLINDAGVKAAKGKSKYKGQTRYTPGTIVPNDNFLLMAFAKLDNDGLGNITYDEFIDCLDTLWQQIDKYHGTSDVYMPIIGSKITRFDKELTQQELLDIILCSYRLSPKKLRKPYKLHIVCREREDFSLNNVFGIKQ